MTQTVTTREGRAYVLITVDHCSGEFIGTYAASRVSRREALEPIRQGLTRRFDGAGPGIASGLILRLGHVSSYMSDGFLNEIRCFSSTSAPAFIGQSEGNGVAERWWSSQPGRAPPRSASATVAEPGAEGP